jgi:hypothetical protein
MAVELDLREWLPDCSLSCEGSTTYKPLAATSSSARASGLPERPASGNPSPPYAAEHSTHCGDKPPGHSEPFIAVCHATVIRALTGHFHTDFCGIRVLEDLS